MFQVMSVFTVLCLRSPDNAARAMEAGAGDLAIQVMEKFSTVQQLQRNSCLMIRNLVARNPENRQVSLHAFFLSCSTSTGRLYFLFLLSYCCSDSPKSRTAILNCGTFSHVRLNFATLQNYSS